MKGNKGKEVTSEGARHEVEPQVRPSTGDKRKTLSKNLDLENLPSRRSKKTKHGSSQVASLILLRLISLPKYLMLIRPLLLRPPRPRLLPNLLCLPRLNLLRKFLQILLKTKVWLGNVSKVRSLKKI